jgi:hypothetical protein
MKRYLKPVTLVETSLPAASAESSTQWVDLLALPDPFSYHQALLLSRQSGDEWIAWIPDYGEVTLHRSEFCFPHEWN